MKQEMMGWQWHQLNHLHLTLLYDFLNIVINAFSLELLRAWFRRKEFINSAAAIGLCCMHKAPVRCLLGFLFYKQWISEVGKQSIFWYRTFSIIFLPKIIATALCMSRIQQVKGGMFFETQCTCTHNYSTLMLIPDTEAGLPWHTDAAVQRQAALVEEWSRYLTPWHSTSEVALVATAPANHGEIMN